MAKPLHILIVDDNEDDALLLVHTLKNGGYEPKFERVDTSEGLASALSRNEWDCIISDYSMPHFNGIEALREFKQYGIDIPFILISGTIGEEVAVEAMKAGAQDYLLKDKLTRLVPALKRELEEVIVRRARKRAEKALQESEEHNRSLVSYARDIIFTIEKDSSLSSLNPAFKTLTHWPQDEWTGKSFQQLIHPEDLPRTIEYFQNIMEGKVIPIFESRICSKEGNYINVEFTMVPYIENGVVVKAMGIGRDVTERKLAEEELVKLRLGIERSLDAIFMTDIDGVIQYVNSAFEQIYGYTSNEAYGKTPRILKSDKLTPSYYKQFWGTLLSKKAIVGEIINKTKDGRLISVEVSNNPILDKQNNIVGFMGIHRDITLRKQSEEKERSLELQLQQAQKLESLGTLAAGIAHDFNNILGIILGHSSLLPLIKEDLQKLEQSIDAITNATKRGASLVKQLLTFARKTEVSITSVNINEIILEIRKLLIEIFPKTIIVSDSLQKELPNINADAGQIHQVLLNLCVNARDAMPNKGTLSISTGIVNNQEIRHQFVNVTSLQYIKIEIADTGIGMDEATSKRIFEPFFTTKDIGKGTGLGLATVFGIVEHFNGFIHVQSTVGKGTTFTIYFPVPDHAPAPSQTDIEKTEELRGGTETILLIEDEEVLRGLLETVLVTKGYSLLTANDGRRGVETYQSHQSEIAAVISDMGLPLLNGRDVAKQIRKINPDAKVIIASGFIDPEIKSEMLQSGIKHFIQKPYSHDEILRKVREVIDTHE